MPSSDLGQLTKALEHLDGPKLNRLADDIERDIIRAEVAYAFFIRGKDKMALTLGGQSVKRSGDYASLGYWAAGLSAYRSGDLEAARLHFEGLAAVSRRAEERRVGKECRSRWCPYH